jgi:hypothetical protein
MFGFIGRMTVLFTVVTPIAALLVVALGGGGHGTYHMAKILFPYTMASTAYTREITMLAAALALLQYPVYGLLLDWGRSKRRGLQYAAAVGAIHVVFVALAFQISNPSFTP